MLNCRRGYFFSLPTEMPPLFLSAMAATRRATAPRQSRCDAFAPPDYACDGRAKKDDTGAPRSRHRRARRADDVDATSLSLKGLASHHRQYFSPAFIELMPRGRAVHERILPHDARVACHDEHSGFKEAI